MLQSLSVKNFILIDELEIEFTEGLCVITGETGAGKSILLDAILFCLGVKSAGNVIKHGKDYAVVNMIFSLNAEIKNFLTHNFIEYDDILIIKCTQKAGISKIEGRKNFFINGQAVNKAILQQLTIYLLELHGQNNNISLLEANTHRDILDSYENLLDMRCELSILYNDWQNTLKEIAEIKLKQNSIDQEIDYLSFVTEELTKLDIQVGEEEKLITIRKDLQNYDKELQIIQDISQHINNQEINNAINKAEKLLAKLGQNEKFSEQFDSVATSIEESYNNLEGARQKLATILDAYNQNEYNLEETEERLFLIKAISRKYNVAADGIGEFLNKSLQQLNLLKNKVAGAADLAIKETNLQKKYYESAKALSAKRHQATKKLEDAMHKELVQLKMAKAIFKIDITPKNIPSSTGIDEIIFKASTNPGTEAGAINKIASGGELSRFMLALKTSLFDKMIKPTIIFDEIDVGIGGEVADKVGERLKKLGSIAQVIVITHQPQVAGKADLHIKIHKEQLEKHTEVKIEILDALGRQQELARMISGQTITEASLKAAKELLHS